ncbi:hypothetical protein GCM10008085_00270 [Winogradskyella epiphytica]|nr:hypothetical protein GCM10008085_00270 [Winogradskyella epiphytica]
MWYAISNSYSIITPEFKVLLDAYIKSKSLSEFSKTLSDDLSASEYTHISETLLNYLQASNSVNASPPVDTIKIDHSQRRISKQYTFEEKTIEVYYSSELVQKIVHPQIAQYYSNTEALIHTTIDTYLKNDVLHLFIDDELITKVPKRDYHYIQGKFIMHLFCILHDKREKDWLGTLHGSTLTDGKNALLFAGQSGKGKSTLCALLTAHGFDLLADDVSPILSEDQHIYYNPAAISIKSGAFELLKTEVPNFEELPVISFTRSKGDLKYLPCKKPKRNHYPCRAIILVNYKAKAETTLERISIKQVLETIIEDSWLSPTPKHAQQFLDWLETLDLYQLTYSDTASVHSEVTKLFQHYHLGL